MRRTAVIVLSVLGSAALGPGCTGRLFLPPPVASDGGFAIDTAVEPGTGGAAGMGRAGGMGGGTPAAGGASGQGGRGGAPRTCHVRQLRFSRPKTSLLLAVGRNASMSTSFGSSGGTRISEVQQKLRDGVMANENAINFGYEDFPGTMSSCSNDGCCANTDTVGPGSPQAVLQRLQCDIGQGNTCVSPSTARPIADALRNARNLLGMDSFRERDLVLIVDGDPSCPSETASDSCEAAKNHLSNLNIDDKRTYVVAVGSDGTTSPCLQMIASQGTTIPPSVYPAGTPDQLRDSLKIIFAKAAAPACLINLDTAPTDASMISVQIQKQTIQPTVNGAGDWSFVPGTHDQTIEVHGTSCQMIQTLTQGTNLIDVWQDGACPPGA